VWRAAQVLEDEAGSGVDEARLPTDVLGWHIGGSPFFLTVGEHGGGADAARLHPYDAGLPLCGASGASEDLRGRWVAKRLCEGGALDCAGAQPQRDDDWVWLPHRCRLRALPPATVSACRDGAAGGWRLVMAGSSQQRTLFFDVAALLGSAQVQPRKYWTDLAATDVAPALHFHWMVPPAPAPTPAPRRGAR
jgi:hypothetical protein